MAQSMIKLKKVYKAYGFDWVLQNINLTIKKGERVVICGASGSGKSTLIRTINGLEPINQGEITVDGDRVEEANLATIRSKTGMLFQAFNLFPHMTILENCVLAQQCVQKKTADEAAAMAMDLLAKVQIVEHTDKYPIALSGGQQQRAAIARGLCMQPEIMLFDEPTSALDPEMIQEVLEVMLELGHSGMTLVCVTHEMGFARSFADTIVFMDAGRIIEKSTPQAFFTNPKNARAQAFLARIKHI